jgi:glucose dehydrogenase
MTYQLPSGRQLVAIAVGGGDAFGEGDHVVVFGLPR